MPSQPCRRYLPEVFCKPNKVKDLGVLGSARRSNSAHLPIRSAVQTPQTTHRPGRKTPNNSRNCSASSASFKPNSLPPLLPATPRRRKIRLPGASYTHPRSPTHPTGPHPSRAAHAYNSRSASSSRSPRRRKSRQPRPCLSSPNRSPPRHKLRPPKQNQLLRPRHQKSSLRQRSRTHPPRLRYRLNPPQSLPQHLPAFPRRPSISPITHSRAATNHARPHESNLPPSKTLSAPTGLPSSAASWS